MQGVSFKWMHAVHSKKYTHGGTFSCLGVVRFNSILSISLRTTSLVLTITLVPLNQSWRTWVNGSNRSTITDDMTRETMYKATVHSLCDILHIILTWWRHQIETFSALLAICAGNSPFTGEFPTQRPVTRGVDVFFDLRLNERLSKQSRGWCFETPSRPLWRHSNVS